MFDAIEIPNSPENFTFKLEIFQQLNEKYSGQLYRQEMYNFECAFMDFKPTELIYVFDFTSLAELNEKEFKSTDECLQYTIKK